MGGFGLMSEEEGDSRQASRHEDVSGIVQWMCGEQAQSAVFVLTTSARKLPQSRTLASHLDATPSSCTRTKQHKAQQAAPVSELTHLEVTRANPLTAAAIVALYKLVHSRGLPPYHARSTCCLTSSMLHTFSRCPNTSTSLHNHTTPTLHRMTTPDSLSGVPKRMQKSSTLCSPSA